MVRTTRFMLAASAGLVVAVFLAGFGGTPGSEAAPTACGVRVPMTVFGEEMAPKDEVFLMEQRLQGGVKNASPGLLNLLTAAGYRRDADFTLRVPDCAESEDALEKQLEEIRGEILEMVMEGTEGSRRCSISMTVPTDRFRDFVTYVRGMGTVQTERITARRLRGGEGGGREGEVDPRELALVKMRMADEKVAPEVLESRGVLATSFDRSASHLFQGVAVIVEGIGYVLPFVIVLAGVFVPAFLLFRWRRAVRYGH